MLETFLHKALALQYFYCASYKHCTLPIQTMKVTDFTQATTQYMKNKQCLHYRHMQALY